MPLGRTKLLWPQTELLKAHVAVFESTGEQNVKQSALMVEQAIRGHYFAGKDQPFFNRLDMNGIPMDIPTPSRVLYHLWMAFTEFERVV
jgi:mannose/cellobiose epimerase-like protein (N-acyl-D-glucosamine 2-epimerase family)